jgi:protein SCO1/2
VTLTTGEYLEPRRPLPNFSLIDQRDRAFGPAELAGHWSMLFFGYTNCPDFCPTTLTVLAGLEQALNAQHAPISPQVVFVSVDAKRDTPAQLSKYVPYFAADFLGVTAPDQATIEAFASKLNVAVVLEPKPDGGYAVDHWGGIFVLDPHGRIAAILTGPFTVAGLKADFEHIVAAGA